MKKSTRLCECGCGEFTNIRKGRPHRFLHGHWAKLRLQALEWSPDLWDINEQGCFIWRRARTKLGYGQFQGQMAHRVSYEKTKGPIPAGLDLDHLCRNPSCVNPEHLEAVSHSENLLRGVRARSKH